MTEAEFLALPNTEEPQPSPYWPPRERVEHIGHHWRELPMQIGWRYKNRCGVALMSASWHEGKSPDEFLESAIFYLTEGNFGCDCNRSFVIGWRNPGEAEGHECGNEIKFEWIEVEGFPRYDIRKSEDD